MKRKILIKLSFISMGFLAFALMACQNQATKQVNQEMQNYKAMKHVTWSKNANIYEVNLRQYTTEGTLQAFQKELPRLKKMGVDILWLMPIFPIGMENRKGSKGSYYAVADYKAVNPEFGSQKDLSALVKEAHKLGMYVILDWVANHSAWDHPWAKNHPDWYQQDSTGKFLSPFDWTDVIAFDYTNPVLRDSMIDALEFWVKEMDVDGYRCDVAGMVPVDFWEEARIRLDGIKPVFMLAEDEEKVALLDHAFDMNYGWKFHHVMNDIAQGKKPASAVWEYIQWNEDTYPSNAYRMQFVTNHDENSWNGTIEERMGEAGDAMAVLSYTMPGMPLIYSGQEAGMDKRLLFFEKDSIDWSKIKKEDFYTMLNQLKKDNKALWNGEAGGSMVPVSEIDDPAVLAFVRQRDENKVFVVMNLSDKAGMFVLNSDQVIGKYVNAINHQVVNFNSLHEFNLKAWEYLIFIQQ